MTPMLLPILRRFLLAGLLATVLAPPAPAAPSCAGCHGGEPHLQALAASVHGDLACTACHQPASSPAGVVRDNAPPKAAGLVHGTSTQPAGVVRDNAPPKAAGLVHGTSTRPAGFVRDNAPPKAAGLGACAVDFQPMDCSRCHEEAARAHAGSVHNSERLPVPCWKCHQDIHALEPIAGDRQASARLCAGCHEDQEVFFASAHGEGLAQGDPNAPGCVDCHSTHAVAAVDNDGPGRSFHTTACMGCHADSTRMAASGVAVVAVETFLHSFHGKTVRLGQTEGVAGCADCHGSHGVWPQDDPRSTVHADNRVETCRQCHTNAGASFARYLPHADDRDPSSSPALYWTRVLMTALLVGTFLFFWAHSLLWALRSFVDRERARATPAPAHAAPTGRVYRRFPRQHIVLHLVVVVSFLTLALTGLPLKFAGTGWGQALAEFFGGPERARLLHHSAAVVTFGWFAVAVWGSLRFLRGGKGTPGGMLGRLLGPDSLFPTLRDWRDFQAMLRWFAFRGPKPSFERWTYWEKFDFLAVFWGMFAIGGSGLLLWFPEFFARFLPGWLFNVATIIHSDEALLATGFIFTVHFFNTHFRPEKFPMDTVIFNGRLSEEEMREERADQWKRYEAEGRLEEFAETRPPRIAWEFAYRIFGLVAVALGLGLAGLMVLTLLGVGL